MKQMSIGQSSSEYDEPLGLATDVVGQVCDFLSEYSHGPIQQFNKKVDAIRQTANQDLPGLAKLPKSGLKQVAIMANFFGHYQKQVESKSKTPLLDAIAPTIADQLGDAGVGALISTMKSGAAEANAALFISGLARACDDYQPFQQAIGRLVKQQDTKIQQHLGELDKHYGNAINVAMHAGAKEHILEIQLNVCMFSMLSRAIDGVLDPIKEKFVQGVDSVKKLIISPDKISVEKGNSGGKYMKTGASMRRVNNEEIQINSIVKKKFNIFVQCCRDTGYRQGALETAFTRQVKEHQTALAAIRNGIQGNNEKITQTLSYVVNINKKLAEMDEQAKSAEVQTQALANFQGVMDAFNLISNIGVSTNNKAMRVFGTVGMSLAQGILGVAQLTGTMGAAAVSGAAMLTPATMFIGAGIAVGSLFLNKGKGNQQAKAMQQFFEAMQEGFARLTDVVLQGNLITYKNQEKIFKLDMEIYKSVIQNFSLLFSQTNRMEHKIDVMALSVEEIKGTLQQHEIAKKCDEVRKLEDSAQRALFNYVEGNEKGYNKNVVKTLQNIEAQLDFSLSSDCRKLPDQKNNLSGWFYLMQFEGLLSEKAFKKFNIDLSNVVNFAWWRSVLGCYLQIAFCITMDKPTVASLKKHINGIVKRDAGATSKYLGVLMDENFMKAFLGYYEDKLETISASAKAVLDEMSQRYSKAGMVKYAEANISNQGNVNYWQPILEAITAESKYQSENYKGYEELLQLTKEFNKTLEGFQFAFENVFVNPGVKFCDIYPHLKAVDEKNYHGYKAKAQKINVGGQQVKLHYIDGELENYFTGHRATKNAVDLCAMKVKKHLQPQKEYLEGVCSFMEEAERLLSVDSAPEKNAQETGVRNNTQAEQSRFMVEGEKGSGTMYMVSQLGKNGSVVVDRHWYVSEEIDTLLAILQQAHRDVTVFTNMLGNDWAAGNTLNAQVKQSQDERKQQLVKNQKVNNKTIIPLNLGTRGGHGIHWVLLYVEFAAGSLTPHTIIYMDPQGNPIPKEVEAALQDKDAYGPVKIQSSDQSLQGDLYNCGPWIVTIAEFLLDTLKSVDRIVISDLLNLLKGFDINAARQGQQTLLKEYNNIFDAGEHNQKLELPVFDDSDQLKAEVVKLKLKPTAKGKNVDAESIQDIIKEVQPAFKPIQAINGYDAVFMLGDSGAGKSMLLNTIFGCEYKAEGNGTRAKVKQTNKTKELFKRGDGVDSQTLIPKVVPVSGKDFAFCDMAGLYENRGEGKRVCAATVAHLLNLTLQESKKQVQGIVFVIDSNDLVPKGKSLRQNLLTLGKMLKSNYQLISESVSFVFTKDKDLTLEWLEGYINSQHKSVNKIEKRTEDESIILGVLTQMKTMLEEKEEKLEKKTLRQRFHITGEVMGETLRKQIVESVSGCTRQPSTAINFFHHNQSQEKFVKRLVKAAKLYLSYQQKLQAVNGVISGIDEAIDTRLKAVRFLSSHACGLKKRHDEKSEASKALNNKNEGLKDEIDKLKTSVKEASDNVKSIINKETWIEIDKDKPITFTHKAQYKEVTKSMRQKVSVHKNYIANGIQADGNVKSLQAQEWTLHPGDYQDHNELNVKKHIWVHVLLTKKVNEYSKNRSQITRSTEKHAFPIKVVPVPSSGVTPTLVKDEDGYKEWKIDYPLGKDCSFKGTVKAQERYLNNNPVLLKQYQDTKAGREKDLKGAEDKLSKADGKLKVLNAYFQGGSPKLIAEYEELLIRYTRELDELFEEKGKCEAELQSIMKNLGNEQMSFESIHDIFEILKFEDKEGVIKRFMQAFKTQEQPTMLDAEQNEHKDDNNNNHDTATNVRVERKLENPGKTQAAVYGGKPLKKQEENPNEKENRKGASNTTETSELTR